MTSVTFVLKRSAAASSVPTTGQLALGELAINTFDGKIYLKKSIAGVEQVVGFTDDSKLGKLAETNRWTGETNGFGLGSGASVPVLGVFTTPNMTNPKGLAVYNGTGVDGKFIHVHTQDGSATVIESLSPVSGEVPFKIINKAAADR